MKNLTELEKIANARTRLDVERLRINEQRRQIRKEIRGYAVYSNVIDYVKKQNIKIETPKLEPLSETKTHGYYIIGDDQYRGEKDAKQVIKTLEAAWKDALLNKHTHITIMHGGDNIEGSHRPSSMVSVQEWATTQAIQYAKILLNMLTKMSENFTITFIMVTIDNHGEYRSVGKAGESQKDNALNFIAEYTKLGTKNNKNITVISKERFFDLKLPGGHYISLSHGNQSISKQPDKFMLNASKSRVFIKLHEHHAEWNQKVTYDYIVGPSAKIHIEPYEEGGGFATVNEKGDYFRRPQIAKISFEKNKGISRVKELSTIAV